MRDIEHQIQVGCVTWFDLSFPHLKQLLFAVPNGGRRDQVTGAKMKAEGVRAGVADMILLIPNANHHSLCIEMKTPTGRQQESQKEFEKLVIQHGNLYVICRSFDEFREVIEKYLANKI